MGITTSWNFLRGEKAGQAQGLRIIQQAYAQQPDASHAMELGVALLWLRDYESAWEHFRSRIEADPRSGDNDYGMAGVAKWCLGQPDEGVLQWRAGLKAKYARTSGLGVIMPLLLFFASVTLPEVFAKSSAIELLLDKAKDIRIKTWPGPIAKLILGQTNEIEFQEYFRGANPQDTRDRQWLTEFYRGLTSFQQGALSRFKRSMHKLTDTSQPEWQEERVFLSRIWKEEFFLARHSAI